MIKTKKIIIALIVLNLAVFGACFYLFANIKKTDKVVSERLIQIESGIKKEESLRSIKNLMDDTKKERERIADFFVQPNGAVDFIEMIDSLGGIAGVKLEVESVGVEALKSETDADSESFRLSLKTKGSWDNTMHLLSLLESLPYQILFESARFQKISDESAPDNGKKIVVSSYWNGNFSFSALKLKNPSKTPSKAD